jgi:protein-disulfide isomerase
MTAHPARTASDLSIPVPKASTPDGAGIAVGSGPVPIDAYIDFQCPFCRQFEVMARPTLDKLLADRLTTLIYHPMNLLDGVSPTAYSTRAAAASGAAADYDRFYEYSHELFVNQPPEGGPGLTDGQLLELGLGIGLSDPGFAEAIRVGRYLLWPAYVTECAVGRGVAGTPSVFVRGVPVAARPAPILAAVYAALA